MIKRNDVFAQGAWDLFHIGHLALLSRARNIASTLTVGIDSDDSITAKKGAPPIIPFLHRAAILRACSHVDFFYESESGIIDIDFLLTHGINVFVLGSDWKYKDLKGKKEAKAAGVKFVYFPYTRHISSTKIQEKILKLGSIK